MQYARSMYYNTLYSHYQNNKGIIVQSKNFHPEIPKESEIKPTTFFSKEEEYKCLPVAHPSLLLSHL